MQNSQNKKVLQIGLFVLVAIVVLGVGYAAISAVNLIINGNATASVDQNNFKVHFTQAQAISGSTGVSGTSTIDSQDDTKATFDVTGLTKVGDYAEAVYTVRNDSNGIGAEITLNLTSSNTEYFKVTETILDDKLQAGEETTAKVKVQMIKTPVTDAVSTSITATLTASPLEDAQAAGGEEKSVDELKPYIYTINTASNMILLNQPMPSGISQYLDFETASAEKRSAGLLAHILKNGIVEESYVVYEDSGKLYYLRGGVDESMLENKPIFDKNVDLLKSKYGNDWSNYCSQSSSGSNLSFSCNSNGISSTVSSNGSVSARNSSYTWDCYVHNNKTVYCNYY